MEDTDTSADSERKISKNRKRVAWKKKIASIQVAKALAKPVQAVKRICTNETEISRKVLRKSLRFITPISLSLRTPVAVDCFPKRRVTSSDSCYAGERKVSLPCEVSVNVDLSSISQNVDATTAETRSLNLELSCDDAERLRLAAGNDQKVRTLSAPWKGPVTPDTIPKEVALSCSGCGFLGTYHFGVMVCFQRHAKTLLSHVTRFSGASAGSLVACLMCYNPESLEAGLKQMYLLADELNSLKLGALTPGFYLNERLQKIIDKFLPDQLPEPRHKLYVSLTRQSDRSNVIVSDFRDRAHLVQCLLASCYIPMYSMGYYATPPEIDGNLYIDGGYTNNLPVFEDVPTITISPFSGSALIAPADSNLFEWRMSLGNQLMKVNMQNIVRGAQALFPPSSQVLHAYYEMGFRDGLKFLLQNGLLEREEGTAL
ncbi:unnamed protein product [Bursaphelenchus xylophilus]|uniref:(pine wood nematode) hypothetical protein n=1 Tax=Bursaphelenchus xylophilus TaxID=6326 RepID=A0A1I7SLG7_BURXY|nr:unnamed protein product [Bursaphelenchus xylophilus]CAG9129583.1 unnamed protein product [Bursaphelenchus xylophilus]